MLTKLEKLHKNSCTWNRVRTGTNLLLQNYTVVSSKKYPGRIVL